MPGRDPQPADPAAGDVASDSTGPLPEAVPPVVVVLVTHDPGWWFEETLASIGSQRYANTSVLVVDAASADPEGLRARVAATLPGAHLRRLEHNPGFGPAADEGVRSVQGAAFHLLCHDDVRLEPDTVQIMVEEAFRSNAGFVGAKVVDWHDPRRLLEVGMGADRFGQPSPYVERGDLDQAQHDGVRDVFYLPGAATLVRADLFEALGGFDPEIGFHGEDLELCWRAHVAGARVVVAPAARVGHLEALGLRRPLDDRRRLQARHRLRAMRACTTTGTRLRTTPVAFLIALVEVVQSVVLGRFRHARDVASAWTWNARHAKGTRARRRSLAGLRQVSDREVRALQVRGSARLSAYLRGQLGRNSTHARDVVSNVREARATTSLLVMGLLVLFLVVGSRELLWGSLPAVGDLPRFDAPGELLGRWLSGYDATGLGSTDASATGLGVFGGLGALLFGATGFLRTVAVLAPLFLGLFGMFRLARPIGSRRGRLVATAVYALVPVGTNALSTGRWAGIVAFGMAPWVISVLASVSQVAPYGEDGGAAGPGVRRRPLLQRVVALGAIVAVAAVVDPSLLLVLPLCGAGLVLGGLLAGQFAGAVRLVVATVGGTALALVLHLPWSLTFLDGWSAIVAPTSLAGRELDLGALLRFGTGPLGAGVASGLFALTAVLPLLIGRRWRVGWAVRAWGVALVGFASVFVGAQGWLSFDQPTPEVLLAPAAVGLALAAGLGMVAFEVDLPDYHFGWRQIVSLVAAGAFLVALVPAIGSTWSGRWELPRGDFRRALTFMSDEAEEQPFRALWLGDAGVLPGVGWALEAPEIDDLGPERTLAYLTTEAGVPTLAGQWPGAATGATPELADAVRAASSGDTSRLGELLAPMGVRYVVVPLGPAPDPYAEDRRYDPADLVAVLESQLDLDGVTVNPGVRVFENAVWGASPALLPPDTAIGDGATDEGAVAQTIPGLAGAGPALSFDAVGTHATGTLDSPGVVYLAEGGGDRWTLEVDGRDAPRSDAFGWASAFTVDTSGPATLSFATPASRWLALAGQVLLWVLALGYLLRVRVVEDERDELELAAPLAPERVVVRPPTERPSRTPRRAPRDRPEADTGPDTVAEEPMAEEPAPDDVTRVVPAITVEGAPRGRRGRRGKGKYAR
nr:glycosyltransferase [Rhabdothermincola salaria]